MTVIQERNRRRLEPLMALTVDHSTFWADGACTGVDAELFFPERGASTREAKTVCATCTVRVDCLTWALDNVERFGIWGGTSERERRRIRRRIAAGQPVPQLVPDDEEESVDLTIAPHPEPLAPPPTNGGRPIDPVTGRPTDACVNCGKRYTPVRRDQRFHSKECARAWYGSHPKGESGKREPRIRKQRGSYKPRAARAAATKSPPEVTPAPTAGTVEGPTPPASTVTSGGADPATRPVDLQSLLGQLLAGCDRWTVEADLGDVHVTVSKGSP